MSLMLLSLPRVIGITTPGNNTLFLRGKMGNLSGTSSKFILSSSSGDISGMNSVSVSITSDKPFQSLSAKKSLIIVYYLV